MYSKLWCYVLSSLPLGLGLTLTMTFSTSSHSVPLPHSNLYFSRNVKRPLPFLFSSCTAVFIFFVYVLSSHMECGTINPIFKWGSLLLLVPNVPNPVFWNKLTFKKCIVFSVRGWFHYTDLFRLSAIYIGCIL